MPFAPLFEQLRNLLAPQNTREAVSSRSSSTSDAVGTPLGTWCIKEEACVGPCWQQWSSWLRFYNTGHRHSATQRSEALPRISRLPLTCQSSTTRCVPSPVVRTARGRPSSSISSKRFALTTCDPCFLPRSLVLLSEVYRPLHCTHARAGRRGREGATRLHLPSQGFCELPRMPILGTSVNKPRKVT